MLIPKSKKAIKDRKHLAFVASLPCVICGQLGVQIHHLIGNYGPDGPVRGWGMRAGDDFTIAMCERHHRLLHADGNEKRYLEAHGIDGLKAARKTWKFSHGG